MYFNVLVIDCIVTLMLRFNNNDYVKVNHFNIIFI